jgi:hypothetical protein
MGLRRGAVTGRHQPSRVTLRCPRIAASFLRSPNLRMRTLAAALIGVALLPASLGETRNPPTVLAEMVTSREVRRASELGVATELAVSAGTLFVERPDDAAEGTTMGVFIVTADGVLIRRAVTFGAASGTLIHVVSGAMPCDRMVVSDMSAWDAFDRLRTR